MMFRVNNNIAIDENEVHMEFVRASGPGGQNVNKVATAVQLRFNVRESLSLPDDVRERLIRLVGKRMTDQGELIIQARRFRTQAQNRQDALRQLIALVSKAAEPPKPHLKTRPTLASKQRRREAKSRQSTIKQLRRSKPRSDE